MWLDALCLELPPDLGPPGHLLALRGIGVVGVELGRGVVRGGDLWAAVVGGLRLLKVLGWESAASKLARSWVEGADVEDPRVSEVQGQESAADEPARSRVEGADVEETPLTLGRLPPGRGPVGAPGLCGAPARGRPGWSRRPWRQGWRGKIWDMGPLDEHVPEVESRRRWPVGSCSFGRTPRRPSRPRPSRRRVPSGSLTWRLLSVVVVRGRVKGGEG